MNMSIEVYTKQASHCQAYKLNSISLVQMHFAGLRRIADGNLFGRPYLKCQKGAGNSSSVVASISVCAGVWDFSVQHFASAGKTLLGEYDEYLSRRMFTPHHVLSLNFDYFD